MACWPPQPTTPPSCFGLKSGTLDTCTISLDARISLLGPRVSSGTWYNEISEPGIGLMPDRYVGHLASL